MHFTASYMLFKSAYNIFSSNLMLSKKSAKYRERSQYEWPDQQNYYEHQKTIVGTLGNIYVYICKTFDNSKIMQNTPVGHFCGA